MQKTDEATIVTVGIPFLNAEKYLKMAIYSVYAQSITNWHLILIDDGSTDNSLKIASAFNWDTRVTVLSDGVNLGLAARLNQISDLATTPFVARMDADDLMSTVRLEKQIMYLSRHPEIDLTSTGLISMNDSCDYRGHRFTPWSVASTFSLLTHSTGIGHATVLGRTEWFIRNPYRGNFDRTEDMELWVRTNQRQDLKIALLADNLYFYREFDSTSTQKVRRSLRSHRLIAKEYPMSPWERLRFNGRLGLSQIISVLLASKLIRILIQKRRNTNNFSIEVKSLFELEFSKIKELDTE
jgi:glycosyltransferase involved in cell wall biosynthesis